MLLFGRIDFFIGGDLIGDFMSAESKLPLVAVVADFQKSPQILMSHPGVGLDKWGICRKLTPFISVPAPSTPSTLG
jgi:NitT/TauT family transport system substrate-binding protein